MPIIFASSIRFEYYTENTLDKLIRQQLAEQMTITLNRAVVDGRHLPPSEMVVDAPYTVLWTDPLAEQTSIAPAGKLDGIGGSR